MAIQILGSINVDRVVSVAALPKAGETVLASGAARLAGGKGANQAVAAARMGAAVAMIAAVGADSAGAWMRGELQREGIDLSALQMVADSATGTAYVVVDRHGENQIIVVPGANERLATGDLPPPAQTTRVRLCQLETPIETAAAFFDPGAARGTRRILNAAPAIPEAARLFADVDLLIVNQTELAVYLGAASRPETVAEACAARALLTRPDQQAIVTLGPGGAVAVRIDGHYHVPAMPTQVVDTTGAGDCFVGTLAALIDQGRTVEQALPIANAAAALCTTTRGAAPTMPTRDAVDAALIAAT